MTLGTDRTTVERWSRADVLAEYARLGLKPISGGDGTEEAKPSAESKEGETKPAEEPPKKVEEKKAEEKKPSAEEAPYLDKDGKRYVLQTEVDRLVGSARQEGHKQGKKEVEAAAREAALKEQGDYKALYEEATTKLAKLESDLKETTLRALRSRIGAKHGLPEELVERLQGDTEAAIEADAKKLAGVAKSVRAAPETEGGNGTRNRQQERGDAGSEQKRRPYSFTKPGDVKRWTSRDARAS